MQRFAMPLAALGLLAAGSTVQAASPPISPSAPPPGSVVEAAAGTSNLAWELVRASGDGNAILSPASVWEALAMTHAGACGEPKNCEGLPVPIERRCWPSAARIA
jgi:serine protease inhibitor